MQAFCKLALLPYLHKDSQQHWYSNISSNFMAFKSSYHNTNYMKNSRKFPKILASSFEASLHKACTTNIKKYCLEKCFNTTVVVSEMK